MIKSILLAGASALAVAATAAQADTFGPGQYTWTAPTTGKYQVDIWGAQGGSGVNPTGAVAGGLGWGEFVNFNLTAGQSLYIWVGARGQDGTICTSGCGYGPNPGGGGGGGGASAVLNSPTTVLNQGIIVG